MSTHTDAVRTSQGSIAYRDTGTGPPVVFVHGLLVNGELWRKIVPRLSRDFRCLVPDLPLGSHSRPMGPSADLTPPGVARLVVELMDALDVPDAIVVGTDTGGAFAQLVASEHPERVDRLVLTNCDAFDNFLPRRYRYLQYGADVPGFIWGLAQLMRSHTIARGPLAYGPLTSTRLPGDLIDSYGASLRADAGVRRDLRKVLTGISPAYTEAAAETFPDFDAPVLVAWGTDDRVFPAEHARRLVESFPDARLVEIANASTFVSEDRPEVLASAIQEFVEQT